LSFGNAGWLVVDGTRPVAALRMEIGDRWQKRLKEIEQQVPPPETIEDLFNDMFNRKKPR